MMPELIDKKRAEAAVFMLMGLFIDRPDREVEFAKAVIHRCCEEIDKQSTIEAEPVIHCKDCAFWERKRISCEGLARCRTGESGCRYRFGHDFCSRAQKTEKKDATRAAEDGMDELTSLIANGSWNDYFGFNDNPGSWAPRWIPCSERLPEESGVYLAYFTFKDRTHAIDLAYINTGCHLGSITHWMPLPEPPKE